MAEIEKVVDTVKTEVVKEATKIADKVKTEAEALKTEVVKEATKIAEDLADKVKTEAENVLKKADLLETRVVEEVKKISWCAPIFSWFGKGGQNRSPFLSKPVETESKSSN
jgi:uncharacterized coiled-coil DUF342 family protein